MSRRRWLPLMKGERMYKIIRNVSLSICFACTMLLTACGNSENITLSAEKSEKAGENVMSTGPVNEENTMPALNLTVGGNVFSVILYDNDAARELLTRMPMEITMGDLHGNEKYYYLQDSLPTDARNIGSIHTGDLMLYGSDCLVLFYEDFQTTFTYTQLGYMEEPEILSEILSDGNVKVSISANGSF